MKIGDLVTLSAYACALDSIPRRYSTWWKSREEGYIEPVGIICLKTEVKSAYLSANENIRYFVSWANDGPPGRVMHGNYFYRKDLKHVR